MIEISDYEPALLGWSVNLEKGGTPEDQCLLCEQLIGWPPNMQGHADDCPYITGIWLIDEAVRCIECDGCGEEHTLQYACDRCNRFFEDGDPYRLVDDATGLVVPYVLAPASSTAICTDCAQRQADALFERMR